MSQNQSIAKQRSILIGKMSDLFVKYFDGEVKPEQFGIRFDELMDKYDQNVYHTGLSISIRKRLIVLLEELKLNPIGMKHLHDISKEIGIGFNFEDGWHVLGEKEDSEKNGNFIGPDSSNIDF